VINESMDDLWAQAVELAVVARTVSVFLSMTRLLRVVPNEHVDIVRAELERFEPAEFWCCAYINIDAPIGTWKTYQREDRTDVVWLCICVSSEDYMALPQLLNDGLKAKQAMSDRN
jgi:hypothetical protein